MATINISKTKPVTKSTAPDATPVVAPDAATPVVAPALAAKPERKPGKPGKPHYERAKGSVKSAVQSLVVACRFLEKYQEDDATSVKRILAEALTTIGAAVGKFESAPTWKRSAKNGSKVNFSFSIGDKVRLRTPKKFEGLLPDEVFTITKIAAGRALIVSGDNSGTPDLKELKPAA